MADFSGLGALDAAAWPVLDELTASTGENAASGIPTGGQAAAAMELDVGRLAADGDGPSSDWLEQLAQGVAEHPDLAPRFPTTRPTLGTTSSTRPACTYCIYNVLIITPRLQGDSAEVL